MIYDYVFVNNISFLWVGSTDGSCYSADESTINTELLFHVMFDEGIVGDYATSTPWG